MDECQWCGQPTVDGICKYCVYDPQEDDDDKESNSF